MKKTALLLMLVFVTNWGFSQKNAMNFVPVLFDTVQIDIYYKKKRLVIKDSLFPDSVRIGYKVLVDFQYPLSDTTKEIYIKSVKLISLEIKSLTTNKQHRIDRYDEPNWSRCNREIWYRYLEIFNYWYRNQPYEKMIYRESCKNKVYMGGVIYTIP